MYGEAICPVGITMFSVQMVTSGVENRFWQHGLQIDLRIVTYFISSGVSAFGAGVQRLNVENISLLENNNPCGVLTYVDRSVTPTPRPSVPNTHRAMFT